MPRPTPTNVLQKQFFERLMSENTSVARILHEIGVSPLEFARWRRNLRFRMRLKRCLRSSRQIARLEVVRSCDLAARWLAEKSAVPSSDLAEQKQHLQVFQGTCDVEPAKPRGAKRRGGGPADGAVKSAGPPSK